jgi:hypothetical protein
MNGWMHGGTDGCRDAGMDAWREGWGAQRELERREAIRASSGEKDEERPQPETYVEVQSVLELIHSWLEYSCNVIFVELGDGETMSAQMRKLPEGILPGPAPKRGFSLAQQETKRRREVRGLTAMS